MASACTSSWVKAPRLPPFARPGSGRGGLFCSGPRPPPGGTRSCSSKCNGADLRFDSPRPGLERILPLPPPPCASERQNTPRFVSVRLMLRPTHQRGVSAMTVATMPSTRWAARVGYDTLHQCAPEGRVPAPDTPGPLPQRLKVQDSPRFIHGLALRRIRHRPRERRHGSRDAVDALG